MSVVHHRSILSLVACLWLAGCAPSATFSEVHELRPIAHEFSAAAPALAPAVAALGMQVAQSSSSEKAITVTALTPEGVRVQITLTPSSDFTSSLDVHGEAERQALEQLATRLAESLAQRLAHQDIDPHLRQQLEQLGYIATDDEPTEGR